jgi:hypothetical protein
MPSIDHEVILRLERDVEQTLGKGHTRLVGDNRARMLVIDDASAWQLVDDVQQDVHDLFIDTSWPMCPRHRRHPLWFKNGAWWCETDDVAVAKLGELVGSSCDPMTARPPVDRTPI